MVTTYAAVNHWVKQNGFVVIFMSEAILPVFMFKIDFTIKFLTRISYVVYKYNKIEDILFDTAFVDVLVYKY